MSTDPLGDRIKDSYENITRSYLPRRTYTLIRVDGKAWHTFTKKLAKPFDPDLVADLNAAAIATAKEISGVQCVYLQSDEISFLLTDFQTLTTQPWFDGNLQKIVSVIASMMTAYFNQARAARYGLGAPIAMFDARAFTIPDPSEVANYFVWRTRDAMRNSIHMVARHYLGHTACDHKNPSQLQEMLFQQCKINWDTFDPIFKSGRTLITVPTPFTTPQGTVVQRATWTVEALPKGDLFKYWKQKIPLYPVEPSTP